MRSSLRDVTRRAYEAYAVSDRVTWILTWPGQVVLCGSSMYWTAEVAAAIREKGLPAYEAKCTLQLQAIVNKVPTVISFKGHHSVLVVDLNCNDAIQPANICMKGLFKPKVLLQSLWNTHLWKAGLESSDARPWDSRYLKI